MDFLVDKPLSSFMNDSGTGLVRLGFIDAPQMSAKEMQSELERLARTSKEALDNSPGLGEKPGTTDKSS